ncbi:MAG: hypothetical protein A4S09_10190 [Proteobacteria bacterium SG_bin7]|nr:MAG: hypothetical protein A4S09_10190 [Proteobacteria bacterium SG_bin7]
MDSSKLHKKNSLILPALLVSVGVVVILVNIVEKMQQQNVPLNRQPVIETTVTKTSDGVRVDNIVGNPNSTDAMSEGASRAAITNFWINAKINFPMPHALKYEKVEIEADDVEILHGVDQTDGTDLFIIARNKITSPYEIAPFLHKTGIGETDDKEIWPKSLPAPEKSVTLPATTKLQPAKIWRFRGSSQNRIISLANRADKVGSYVFIYSVPKSNLNRSEEFLIALLKEAIAQ